MSRNYNKVILMGHVGGDPEQRSDTVASFSLATNSSWKDKTSGEYKERTDWHRVTAFGRQVQSVMKHIAKGKGVMIEGELRTDSYEKDGENRSSTYVSMQSFQLLDYTQSNGNTTPRELEEDDVPF